MRKGVDLGLFVLLLVYLAWVPMPFGSATDSSQLPLIVPPLVLCAVAALLRVSKERPFRMTAPGLIWTAGAVLFAAVIALQLIPMPLSLLRVLSPQAAAIWSRAGR